MDPKTIPVGFMEARHKISLLAENRQAVAEFLLHVAEDLLMKEIETVKQAGCPEEAVGHSIEAARKALEIASRITIPVDFRPKVLTVWGTGWLAPYLTVWDFSGSCCFEEHCIVR